VVDGVCSVDHVAERDSLVQEHARLENEVKNLVAVATAGGDVQALAAALRERSDRLTVIAHALQMPLSAPTNRPWQPPWSPVAAIGGVSCGRRTSSLRDVS